ncbi:BRCA1-associated protein isoform X1 [Mauremys reevesii]|uniref:BRCA1-associated protein isoform X1 n=1 Tax=Mauremys reevesii TaxID=260615 RepID=UPI00193EEFC4|nr:BRCA1-associated protein isoform X1 [Mauremys reevesii]
MSVSLVVIRLELAEHSSLPAGFPYSAAATDMSDEEIKEKSLASATACLEGKAPMEKAATIHQHIGRREMTDMIIETIKSNPDETQAAVEGRKSSEASSVDDKSKRDGQTKECIEAAPDSPSKQLPDQISFFSGNPSVEIVHGIMHLYKTNKMTSLKEDVRRSAMLCILTVPATMTSHDLMKFVASFYEVIEHMKIIRDSTPNQYMVLIKFSTQADADSFYMACNGRQFNSIEEDVCQLVYVERAEVFKSEDGASLPVMDLTELPKCTVCLERMDESVNGILTTVCNHSFHSQCLQRWEDTTCPVCRYCQTPEPVEENKCFECGVQEYSYLLTSQLESQRIYWENKIVRIEKDTAEEINNMKTKFKETIEKCDNLEHRLNNLLKEKQSVERKCVQLNNKVAKLSNELKEEQEMNKCLRANQVLLQNKLKEEEKVLKETCEQKDLQITEIQEQLRDVMFYLETQQKINHLPAETRQEIQEGQINIAVASSASSPAGGMGKPPSRRGRSKRGK